MDRIIYKLFKNRIFHARQSILGVQVNLLSRHLHRILNKGHCESKTELSFGVVKPVFTMIKLIEAGDDDSDRRRLRETHPPEKIIFRVSLRSSIIFPRIGIS